MHAMTTMVGQNGESSGTAALLCCCSLMVVSWLGLVVWSTMMVEIYIHILWSSGRERGPAGGGDDI